VVPLAAPSRPSHTTQPWECDIDRRTFLGTLVGSFLAAPLAAEAQEVGRVYRVGLIFTTSPVSEREEGFGAPAEESQE
jgi:hypothetical protein